MKIKLLIIALLCTTNTSLAYNDYGYSYGVGGTNTGGYDSSMALRERRNDFYRLQQLQQPSMNALGQQIIQQSTMDNRSYSTSQPQTLYNPNPNYTPNLYSY